MDREESHFPRSKIGCAQGSLEGQVLCAEGKRFHESSPALPSGEYLLLKCRKCALLT